ncbi:MAG: glycosyltransferase family 4 protein [Desulfopila sp.]|nr:glycosyltransferase family 4 protein [Desulfopila sp.]
MKIFYYMPFKPPGHKNPSGDLIIGVELLQFLKKKGVDIRVVSRFRCRWIYLKPHLWPLLIIEIWRVLRLCKKERPDIWLTYHSYYKAPDILGSLCCRILGIPYGIFQGIYSTKRRKVLKSRLGFYLNRLALQSASVVYTNKKADYVNLIRLLPEEKVMYIAPGLHPEDFRFEAAAREVIRQKLQVGDRVVVMTAAMFRPGVKTEGIFNVIESCRLLRDKGWDILLLIAGDGIKREEIECYAQDMLGDAAVLLGRIPRHTLKKYYSAADIFAFPGIEESLGMVFLEAQACSLPVVAFREWGAREAVLENKTGFLCSAKEARLFSHYLAKLAGDGALRRKMGEAGQQHIALHHDIKINYSHLYRHLKKIAGETGKGRTVARRS